MSRSRLALVIVAAGAGRRMEGIDKIWADLGGRPVLAHALTRLAPAAEETILVVRQDAVDLARARFESEVPGLQVVAGGLERSDSVFNGLRASSLPDFVAVHDAARPFATLSMLLQGREILARCDGAVPAVDVNDTLKQIDEQGIIQATVDRAALRAVQTPQLFRAGPLVEAYETFLGGERRSVTDDASLLEALGAPVATFPGSPLNFKITTGLDLELARRIVACGTDPL